MRILIGCESSGTVRDAFIRQGHDAWSCDILPTDSEGPHIQDDVLKRLTWTHWDMLIAFPPCTHLCVSGAKHFEAKRKDGRQKEGIDFFMALVNAPIPRIAIENPIGIMSTLYRKPDQIIQPWMFGHGETKATCLWLKNLPPLIHAAEDELFMAKTHVEGREQRVHNMAPGPNRWKERSKTFSGIADAMASQWNFK